MYMEYDLDLPESLGTKKCYDCGLEPEQGEIFWEKFIMYFNEEVSVPICDDCMANYSIGGLCEPPEEEIMLPRDVILN